MKVSGPRQLYHLLAAALLLLALFIQLILGAGHQSATMDEQLHLLNGVSWFVSAEQQVIVGNPPLVNILQAIPLLALDDARLPTDSPLWPGTRWQEISQLFLWQTNGDRALRLVFLARLPVMALTLLLAAGVYRWARELFGPAAGLLAALLCVFDPNILAHGRLATTDLGAACFTLWAAYLFWRYRMRPAPGRFMLAGLALGAALATKFSTALLAPAFAVLSLWPADRRQWPGEARRGLVGLAAVAALALLAAYRFDPSTLLAEYDWQRLHFATGHAAFLMGQHSTSGWWTYFPVALALKTPLPLLILTAAGLVSLRRRPRDLAFLVLPPLLLFAISLTSRVNIGYRYLLPLLPFLFLLASGVARLTPHASHLTFHVSHFTPHAAIAVLIGWSILGTLRLYPHHLAYFNELAGGPQNGWRYLVDSNLDWGQDLPGLRAYMENRDLERVYLAWFGDAPPERYGVTYTPLPSWPLFDAEPWHRVYHPQRPPPGTYAISATHLQGVYLADHDTYAWFRGRQPTAQIGYSIFIYDVPHSGGPPVYVGLSGLAIDQVDVQTFDAAFGANDLSLRWFDARGGLVLPAGGRDAWYLLAEATPPDPALRTRFFATLSPWGQRQTIDGRPYVLYRLSAADVARLSMPAGQSPAWWSPAATFPAGFERRPLPLPADFEGRLAFLGYEPSTDRLRPGEELVLLTYWRVEAAFEPPLALFVHLLDESGQVRAQHDGLAIDPVGLETGDVFVQAHRLAIPADVPAGEYHGEIGVYRPDNGHRWAVYADETALTDRLLLQAVRIETQ